MNSPQYEKAQEIMSLAERHGWRMLLDPKPYGWIKLELWRNDEYLQLNWVEPEGRIPGRLADTRRYRSASRDTKSFTLAQALRIIQTHA